MKLLHFVSGGQEYIVLSTGDAPDDEFARSGFEMTVYELPGDEWPVGLPTDRELTP
jgi:hypothetical protein